MGEMNFMSANTTTSNFACFLNGIPCCQNGNILNVQINKFCQSMSLKMEVMFSKVIFMLPNIKSINGTQIESDFCQNTFYVGHNSINAKIDKMHFLRNECLCWTWRSSSGDWRGPGQELQCCCHPQATCSPPLVS